MQMEWRTCLVTGQLFDYMMYTYIVWTWHCLSISWQTEREIRKEVDRSIRFEKENNRDIHTHRHRLCKGIMHENISLSNLSFDNSVPLQWNPIEQKNEPSFSMLIQLTVWDSNACFFFTRFCMCEEEWWCIITKTKTKNRSSPLRNVYSNKWDLYRQMSQEIEIYIDKKQSFCSIYLG